MAVQRQNPLPPGTYWVDVFEPWRIKFQAWLLAQKGKLTIVRTTHYAANAGGPSRDWILFKVLSPVPWQGPGFPTIASDSTTPEDTVQRPPPEKDPLDKLDDFAASFSGAFKWALLLGGGYLAWKVATRDK